MANSIKIIGSWPSGQTEYVTGMENPERLPVVSASDNGDVLTVVDGKWKDAAPGGGLPSVTSDDNGDVLTVVEGEWAKAAPSGGGGGWLLVRYTREEVSAGVYTITADKTAQALVEALDGDVPIVIVEDYTFDASGDGTIMAHAQSAYTALQDGFYYMYFAEPIEVEGQTQPAGYYFALPYVAGGTNENGEFYAATLSDYPSTTGNGK